MAELKMNLTTEEKIQLVEMEIASNLNKLHETSKKMHSNLNNINTLTNDWLNICITKHNSIDINTIVGYRITINCCVETFFDISKYGALQRRIIWPKNTAKIMINHINTELPKYGGKPIKLITKPYGNKPNLSDAYYIKVKNQKVIESYYYGTTVGNIQKMWKFTMKKTPKNQLHKWEPNMTNVFETKLCRVKSFDKLKKRKINKLTQEMKKEETPNDDKNTEPLSKKQRRS